MTQQPSEYNVDTVYRRFLQVLDPSNKELVRLSEFVAAFRELAKFFNHLNVVFTFVANDLIDKFDILDGLHAKDSSNYRSVQSMIEYEKQNNDQTGTVALLRLLRGLEFTKLFMERAIVSHNGSSTPKQVAWDVYKNTLHKRHTRPIRVSIWLATATIPKHEVLNEILLRGQIEDKTTERLFPLIEQIYQHIHHLYEENDLLELVFL